MVLYSNTKGGTPWNMDKENIQQTDEIKSERGYYRQVFASQTDKKKNIARLYQNPVFYNNKLSVGDGELGMRKIDYTLSFNETKKAWIFEYNNYLPSIPEYADEWIDLRDLFFDKDTTIRMKSVAKHVKGRFVEDLPGISNGYNAVIYDDAFDKGVDLIVHPMATGLRKLVRVREYARDKDLTFDFELNLPGDLPASISKSKEKTKKGSDLKGTDTIVLSDGKKIKIGTDSKTSNETFTYIKPVRVWDSGKIGEKTGQKMEIAEAQILTIDGKKILRKVITAKFLEDAVGDVFTDSVVTIQEDKDTYYGTVYTTGGNPTGTTLNIGGWGDYYYSYIEWDLTGSPIVASECLISLMVAGVAANSPLPVVRRVTSAWTEVGVTNAAHPTENTITIATLTSPITIGVGNRDSQDITSLYNSWKDNTYDNYGIKIHSTSNNNTASNYYSSDDATADNRPYLQVTYTALTVTTDAATNIADTTLDANANLTSSGKYPVTRRGFAYDTSSHANPGDTDPDVSDYASVLDDNASTTPILVQKGEATMASGVTSNVTITLDTPVPVGKSFPLISTSTDHNYPAYSLAYIELRTIVGSDYTQVYISRPYTTGNVKYEWQVISGDDFTVQNALANTANVTELDVPITTVDRTKAFAVGSSVCNSTGMTVALHRLTLTSDTNLRINSGTAGTYSYCRWYVVEWTGATVQAGTWDFNGTVEANGTHDATITAVDLSKTFVLFTQLMQSFSSNPGIIKTQVTLTSTTNLRLYKRLYYASGTYGSVSYFVISHPNISVTHGVSSGGTTGLTYTAGTLAIDETKTFASTTQIGNSNCSSNANSINERGVSSDRVLNISGAKYYQAERGVAVDAIYPAYMIVEDQGERFNPGTFTESVTGLTAGDVIYVRSFVENTDGFVYGDELSYTIPLPLSVSDSVSLSGAVSAGPLDCPAIVLDTAIVSESIVSFASLNNFAVDDQVSLLDTLSLTEYSYVSVADTVSTGENIAIETFSFALVDDTIIIGEDVSMSSSSFVSVDDSIVLSELISSSSSSFTSVNDTITISEFLAGDIIPLVSVSDSITIVESLDTESTMSGVSVQDITTLNELINRDLSTSPISLSDSIILSESILSSLEINIVSMDTVTATDIVSQMLLEISTSVTDNITLAESILSQIGDLNISKQDTVTVNEDINSLLASLISVIDNITLSESITTKIGDLNISKTDSVTISENINRILIMLRSVSDTLTISESVLTILGGLTISTSDAITLSENLVLELNRFLSVLESLSIAEAITTKISDLSVVKHDDLSIAESVSMVMGDITLTASESSSLLEDIHIVLNSLISTFDTLTIVEGVTISTQRYSPMISKNRPRGGVKIQDRIGKIYIPSNRGGVTPSKDLCGIIR